MTLPAIIYVLLVAGLLGFAASRVWPDTTGRSAVTAWMCGSALAPALISLTELALYQTLPAPLLSSSLLMAAPAVPAILLARLAFAATRDTPVLPPNTIDTRKMVLIVLFLFLAFGSLVALLIHNVTTPQVDHDLLVYLTEAKNIRDAVTLPAGSAAPTEIRQPHSLAYGNYLAWGFFFESTPGFGGDTTPKALIALNHIALLVAVGGLVYGIANWYWAVIAAAAILMNPVFDYQVNAFARDSFYAAPTLSLLALLIHSRSGFSRTSLLHALLTFVAVLGAVNGHSLGLVSSGAVLAGVMATKTLRNRSLPLANPSLLTATIAILTTAAIQVSRLVGGSEVSKSTGFAFPFYSDPFIKQAFEQSSSWGASPDLWTLLSKVLDYNDISLSLAVVATALVIYTGFIRHAPSGQEVAREISLAAFIGALVILLTAAFLPLKLDGITLASAFGSNLRYGFVLGILFMIATIVAAHVVITRMSDKVAVLIGFVTLVVVSLASYDATRGHWPSSQYETRATFSRIDTCRHFLSKGVRTAYSDGDDFLYLCPGVSRYIFTEQGARLLAMESDDAIRHELDAQGIDAVILKRSIRYWWEGARFYRFLQRNWTRLPTPYDTVFVRPDLER